MIYQSLNGMLVKIYDDIINFINRDCSDNDDKRDVKVIFVSFIDSDGNPDGFVLENISLK